MHRLTQPGGSSARGARRLLCLCVALPVLLIAVAPQAYVMLSRGREWNGSFAYLQIDERAYAAYVNALADGRPRRNDPYTGRDDRAGAPQPESLFSIQFVPAYALALTARVLHSSTSAAFFALLCAAAVAAPLAVFRLIHALTGDARLAAAGALAVVCLGSVASGYGVWATTQGTEPAVRLRHLPFLRRYQPALAFPLFFVLCALVRRSLTTEHRRTAYRAATLAGVVFALLVFSYFYLWTAALAWLACLALVWLAARPADRRRTLLRLTVVAAIGAAALVPYALLLSRRATNLETAQGLAHTHAPDLVRVPELIGFALLLLLLWARRRGQFKWDDQSALFAASFALLPFAVFNQQIASGLSLQPFHYDIYVANYCVLLAATLVARLSLARPIPARLLLSAALAALIWASFETAVSTRRFGTFLLLQDEIDAAASRLSRLGHDGARLDTSSLVFSPLSPVNELLPTGAPQPVLWAQHTAFFPGASPAEEHERLLQYLYYSGVDLSTAAGRDYEALDRRDKFYFYLLLGAVRANRELNAAWQPVTRNEIARELEAYKIYAATFDRERAARFALSYVLVEDRAAALPNLDRWYERDGGERIGSLVLYRVRLRP
jgi:hypothetical protein